MPTLRIWPMRGDEKRDFTRSWHPACANDGAKSNGNAVPMREKSCLRKNENPFDKKMKKAKSSNNNNNNRSSEDDVISEGVENEQDVHAPTADVPGGDGFATVPDMDGQVNTGTTTAEAETISV
mmetsp:Transcript_11232/g.18068  ORF Transcript_11232/g.18068 Transcript_11232/m.18068 type:complete len:124 (-) Transcript_11232:412-783(-)